MIRHTRCQGACLGHFMATLLGGTVPGAKLRRLSAHQASDFYEVIIERHSRASTIVTSNRAIEERIPLFDDPILAQRALDRLAHNAFQIVMEGDSYRSRQRPGRDTSLPPRKGKR